MLGRTAFYRFRTILVIAVLLSAALIAATPRVTRADAAVDHVTNCLIGQDGSLDTVLGESGPGDRVVFDQDCSGSNAIDLSQIDSPIGLEIEQDVTVDGSGHTIVLDGKFDPSSDESPANLAAITVDGGINFTLEDVTVLHTGSELSALWNEGDTNIIDCQFIENFGISAGAIGNVGILSVSGTTFARNLGLYSGAVGTTNLSVSTDVPSLARATTSSTDASRLQTRMSLSPLDDLAGVTIVNSTFTGNASLEGLDPSESNPYGTAITEDGSESVTIGSSTIADNGAVPTFFAPLVADISDVPPPTSAPAVVALTGTVSFANSIVSGSGPAGDCAVGTGDPSAGIGTIVDLGYNLEDDVPTESQPSCGFSAINHSLVGVSPNLLPLANNGGLTPTMALPGAGMPGYPSPAMDAGTCGLGFLTPLVDQRGITRPQGTACDIGAYELFQGYLLTVIFSPPPPYSSYTGTHITDNGAPLGFASIGAPLKVRVTGPVSLGADQVVVATLTSNTFFFTGFQPVVTGPLTADTTTYATYTSIEQTLLSSRSNGFLGSSSVQVQTYTKLYNQWALVENAIKMPYITQTTRLTDVKAFACGVSSARSGGKISATLASQLETYAGWTYNALGGTFSGTTLC